MSELNWQPCGKLFRDLGDLRAAGVMIEYDDGDGVTRTLIGDINEQGGVCDDCNIGNPLVLRTLDLRPMLDAIPEAP